MIVALEQYRPLGTSVVRKLGICIFEIAVRFFIDFTVLFQLTFAVHQRPCALKSIQHSYPRYEFFAMSVRMFRGSMPLWNGLLSTRPPTSLKGVR